MANPLVDELIIDTPFKDHWNVSEPEDEGQFEELFKDPTFATELFLVFGFPVTPAPRTDLIELLLKYPDQLPDGDCVSICSELLRLDVTVPPRAAELQKRLGGVNQDAAGLPDPDPAGVPNGRRPNDDVTDILIRIVGGPVYDGARAGDGVNFLQDAPGIGTADGPGYGSVPGNDLDVTLNGIAKEFPFLPTPHDGVNRRHIDCEEAGGNSC